MVDTANWCYNNWLKLGADKKPLGIRTALDARYHMDELLFVNMAQADEGGDALRRKASRARFGVRNKKLTLLNLDRLPKTRLTYE